jgi:hypothetical protein
MSRNCGTPAPVFWEAFKFLKQVDVHEIISSF